MNQTPTWFRSFIPVPFLSRRFQFVCPVVKLHKVISIKLIYITLMELSSILIIVPPTPLTGPFGGLERGRQLMKFFFETLGEIRTAGKTNLKRNIGDVSEICLQ